VPQKYAPGSPEDWLSRAKGKLALARQPLPPGGYWEDLCFMAQQAAELSIKAVYQRHDWQFPFIHDLRKLLDSLEAKGLTIPEHLREAERLTIYATQLRYPGTTGFVTQEEHAAMLAIAETLYAWAEAIVNQ